MALFTAIYTAAADLLGGGSSVKQYCRSADIMSDAAYSILTRDSRKCSGNFYTDEEVLRQEGVTDFVKYCLVPGKSFLSFCIPQIFQSGCAG